MKNDIYNKEASNILKAELKRKGLSYEELVESLKQNDVIETYASVSNKIARGTFSFAFFIQCMEAIGKKKVTLK